MKGEFIMARTYKGGSEVTVPSFDRTVAGDTSCFGNSLRHPHAPHRPGKTAPIDTTVAALQWADTGYVSGTKGRRRIIR